MGRARARGARRRPRQEAAHRPQPQRPGRHRPAAVDPQAARRAAARGRCRDREPALACRPRARHRLPRLHAPAARAAGALRALVPGLRGDAHARHRAHGRCGAARRILPARLRCACGHRVPDRPHAARARPWVHGPDRQLARCGERPGLCRREPLGGRAMRDAPLADGRGHHLLRDWRGRARGALRCGDERVEPHAAEEEPRCARADPRQVGPDRGLAHDAADGAQGASACLQQGPSGGQGAAL